MKLKRMITTTTITIAGLFLGACGPVVEQESITVVGSTAMQPLVEAAGEQFSSENLGKYINVQGGGSGTGLSQISAGAVDIGNSDVFAEQKDEIDASKLEDHLVAVVGIGPIVNPEVDVDDVSLDELAKIFTGEITNWSELGGKDRKIVVINRASGSGTRGAFESIIFQEGQKSMITQEQEANGTVRSIVSSTPGTISYVAFPYFDDSIKALHVNGFEPVDENVYTNDWVIWAYQHMYTNGEAEGLTKEFIDYMLSDTTQENLVPRVGYIPVSKMEVERDLDGNVTDIEK
ncbi:phosphate ABC transporter substrate-binding protein PstS family protein [Lacticigenium naphthae]|uniref:phosphate ABC transporter substrate-binding protein PstS family protein n=1 Tax=Lacticigenium naphthae TaxID=515351 RepID=UPI0003F4E017